MNKKLKSMIVSLAEAVSFATIFSASIADASYPVPYPRCGITGTIQSSEFKTANAASGHPAGYFLSIKIDSSKYVSGNTSLDTCAQLYPVGATHHGYFINSEKLITRNQRFNVGQKIDIPIVDIDDSGRSFTVYLLPGTTETPKFQYHTNLSYGMKNDTDVMDLQEQLALYAAIYPERLVTGNFGPATLRAVKRFQAKWNIPQTGYVGPMTRAKLVQLMTTVNATSN